MTFAKVKGHHKPFDAYGAKCAQEENCFQILIYSVANFCLSSFWLFCFCFVLIFFKISMGLLTMEVSTGWRCYVF